MCSSTVPLSRARNLFILAIFAVIIEPTYAADDTPTPGKANLPIQLEEVAEIVPPGPTGQIVRLVAISHNHLLMATRRNTERPEGSWSEQFAHLFRRRGHGKWVYVRTLATTSLPNQETPTMAIDMRDRIAAVNAGELMVFELVGSHWKQVARLPSRGNLDLEIDAGTIVVSAPGCVFEAFRKVKDSWTQVGSASQSTTCVQLRGFGEDIDISGPRIALANPFVSNPQGTQWPSRVRVFEGLSSSTPAAFITDPTGQEDRPFANHVAVANGTIFVEAGNSVLAFNRQSGGTWIHVATLEPRDSDTLQFVSSLQSRDGLTATGFVHYPVGGVTKGSVRVFRREKYEPETYTEIATLAPSDATAQTMFANTLFGRDVDIDGRRIAVASPRAAYVFRLPARILKQD